MQIQRLLEQRPNMRLKKLQLLLLAALLALFSSRVRCQYPPPSSSPAPSSPAVNVTEVVAAVRKSFSEPTAHSFALKTELNLNGSSISVGESFDANTLVVQFRFNACAGVQLHHHSEVELIQGVTGSATIGLISPRGTLTAYNISQAEAVVIPSGWPHYYVNRECQETVLVATWPAGAKTTFELSVLSAIPPAMLTNMFAASGPAPTPKPGFPLIYDNDCLKYCAAATAPPPPVPGAGAP